MRRNLLSWQWALYPRNHTVRSNLLRHILSWPFFPGGLLTAIAGIALAIWWLIPIGLIAPPVVMAIQGGGHRLESEPPVPFDGPADAVTRILVEQLITFPRFVLSGAFGRAWSKAEIRPRTE
jgi:hypothetical protein